MAFLKALRTIGLLTSKDASDYYDLVGEDIAGHDASFTDASMPIWLNLGYWETARTYPEAAAALACLLGDAAELRAGDELLDVGFGFGEQDFLWMARHDLKKITGLNISPLHVERAQARVRERGMQERMDLRLGSATEMPFDNESFDKVTALESAFHFNTREKFFAEAYRVLRPGGRIATADGVTTPERSKMTFVNKLVLKMFSAPLENMYDKEEYCRKLEHHGFVNARYRSIRNYVCAGATKYREIRKKGVPLKDAVIELTPEEIEKCYGLDQFAMGGFTDYCIFTADKPA